jgi:Na+(H+)/acetate symporter ActP
MKMNRKLTLVTLCGGLAFALAASAASAQTVISVTVDNSTSITAVYSFLSGVGSTVPSPPSNIAPLGNTAFTVSNTYTFPVAAFNFYYTSSTKQCKFMSSLTTNGQGIPTWTKSATSTGTTSATCSATITYAEPGSPYNYSVTYGIQ